MRIFFTAARFFATPLFLGFLRPICGNFSAVFWPLFVCATARLFYAGYFFRARVLLVPVFCGYSRPIITVLCVCVVCAVGGEYFCPSLFPRDSASRGVSCPLLVVNPPLPPSGAGAVASLAPLPHGDFVNPLHEVLWLQWDSWGISPCWARSPQKVFTLNSWPCNACAFSGLIGWCCVSRFCWQTDTLLILE